MKRPIWCHISHAELVLDIASGEKLPYHVCRNKDHIPVVEHFNVDANATQNQESFQGNLGEGRKVRLLEGPIPKPTPDCY